METFGGKCETVKDELLADFYFLGNFVYFLGNEDLKTFIL